MARRSELSDFSVQELKRGSEQAFDRIFRYFYAPICFFARRLVQDPFAAEEIVQDTFLKLWQKHADFDNLLAVKAFLYISIRNASVNYLERERRKAGHQKTMAYQAELLEEAVLDKIIHTEMLCKIYDAMDELPGQCRKIMKMLFEEDKKPREVAGELDLSVSTVNNQKARGLSLLKSHLSKNDFNTLLTLLLS